MSYRSFTAGDVFTIAAGLLNDQQQDVYTNEALTPMLQLAIQELQEFFELNNIPITNNTSAVIEVDAGVESMGFVGDTAAPNLPSDLVEIQQLWYSQRDQNNWFPMTKRDYLPHYLETVDINPLTYWAWYRERINFLPAIADSDVKMDYIQTLFNDIVDENSQLNLINGRTVLEYRTAALAAEFIGENKTRADSLNEKAVPAIERLTGISIKGQQSIPTRRRPFRQSYKMRRWIS
jgi:hypothetical protein